MAKRESLKTKLFKLVYDEFSDYAKLDNNGTIPIKKHAFFSLYNFIVENDLEQEYQDWKAEIEAED